MTPEVSECVFSESEKLEKVSPNSCVFVQLLGLVYYAKLLNVSTNS